MDDPPAPDLPTRRRILRRVVGQAYGVIAALLLVSVATTESEIPLWARGIAMVVVLLIGAGVAEVFIRVAAARYPTMRLPAGANIVAAIVGSMVGFAVSLGVQALLGYPGEWSWATLAEALVSAPVWLVFLGSIMAARWRYLALRSGLMEKLIAIETARVMERDALAHAREAVADSVRPSLVTLREQIDDVLDADGEGQGGHLQRQEAAAGLRRSATSVVRPLSHEVFERGAEQRAPRRPLSFLAAIVQTQPFRPVLVSLLYLATALPRNVEEYGVFALPALAVDILFIVAILGGANVLMRRWSGAHAWIYVGTLVVIHALPLLLVIPELADTDPQYSGLATLVEIAVSVILLMGTSSLGLLDARREAMLEHLREEVSDERVAQAAEARVLAIAARELGARLHGPVQSQILAAAAALERAVEVDNGQALAALGRAAAAIDTALAAPDDANTSDPLPVLLDAVIEPWRELCPVHLSVDVDSVDLSSEAATAAAAVVREAVVNAYRHGGATSAEVSLAARDGNLEIIVCDDGLGTTTKSWGLGLTLIDRHTSGHWTLTREGERTVLSARILLGDLSSGR